MRKSRAHWAEAGRETDCWKGALMPRFRTPRVDDAEAMWRIVDRTDNLDDNSPYLYLLLCRDFAQTCIVAEDEEGDLVGFVTGYRRPERPDTYFLWQVTVAASQRGKGLARRMVRELLAGLAEDGVRRLEATVTPSNEPSMRMFRGFARELGVECRETMIFPETLFPDGDHEDEVLFAIGPFDPQHFSETRAPELVEAS